MDFFVLPFSNQTVQEEEDDAAYRYIPSTYFVYISEQQRVFFLWIFIVLTSIALIVNIAAIYSVTKRKFRVIQKTCIISLALSDLLDTIIIGLNNIKGLSQELLTWDLGSFLCGFIPMGQTTGIIASSIALTFIALDRYRNVVHALNNRWNPCLIKCLTLTIILWLSCFAISYPMYVFFEFWNVAIIYTRINSTGFPVVEKLVNSAICLSLKKDELRIYYILISILIFLPLFFIFLWFYYKIADIVWKHRKPVAHKFNPELESSSNNVTKTTEISVTTSNNKKAPKMKKSHDIRVERKIRTFKIILTLMSVFILCRLPYYIISVYKTSMPNSDPGEWLWVANYVTLLLHILNCILNPLLYTFLNTTLNICGKVKKVALNFIWEICCFCFSNAEFEEFEKENPFVVENVNNNSVKEGNNRKSQRSLKVKFVEEVKDESNTSAEILKY